MPPVAPTLVVPPLASEPLAPIIPPVLGEPPDPGIPDSAEHARITKAAAIVENCTFVERIRGFPDCMIAEYPRVARRLAFTVALRRKLRPGAALRGKTLSSRRATQTD
jgi:hypothetical protein